MPLPMPRFNKTRTLPLLAGALLASAAGAALAFGGGPGGPLKRADSDGDGAISRAEVEQAATEHFQMLDRNHDGVLTQEEFVGDRVSHLMAADSNGDGKVDRSELRAEFRAHRGRGGPGEPDDGPRPPDAP